MRAALLPTPADPHALGYWLRNFETWRDAVDELVVYANAPLRDDAVEYGRRAVAAVGGRFLFEAGYVGHAQALVRLLEETKADHVVLCEDDAYVRRPSAVADAFALIEQGDTDVVGSPRGEDYAYSPLQVWPERVTRDLAELGRGLWPAFLFARRADLLATDREFSARVWRTTTVIPGYGVVTPEMCDYIGLAPDSLHLDTFFGATMQLRAKGLRMFLVHRVRTYDARATEEWVRNDPPWFHVTGLSTLPAALGNADPSTLPDMGSGGGLWTRRLAWWWRQAETTDAPGTAERLTRLRAFADRAGIDWAEVERWMARFEPWITWAEARVAA